MKDKYEYEEVEEFQDEILKKQKGEFDLKQERLNAIYKNKEQYKSLKIAERLRQEVLREKSRK
jgi:hypothetical protein